MRLRYLALILSLSLSSAFVGCSSKPTGANGSSSTTTTTDNTPVPTPAPAPAQAVTVPAGTMVTVRLGQTVGSKVSQAGQSFSATLARAIEVDGQPAIPAGAAATGTVVDAQPLGHFAGGARLALRLTSLTVNGTAEPIQTSAVVHVLKGKGKRTGIMTGGGAGIGAIIGAIAGGGKGAAIGAAAGAGAGVGAGALTGNKEIVLPAESAVTFKLQQPLQVQ